MQRLLFILLCLAIVPTLYGQVIDSTSQRNAVDSTIITDGPTITRDTTTQQFPPVLQGDSTSISSNPASLPETQSQKEDNGYGIFSMFSGNPGKAALYSIILPGAGQAYNKRWWKVPIAIAIEGTIIYYLQDNISTYKMWDQEWKSVVEGNPPSIVPNITEDTVKRIRDGARQNKDTAWAALIGAHIIIAADAFVDRHLIEFDIDDDLTLNVRPAQTVPGVGLVFTF